MRFSLLRGFKAPSVFLETWKETDSFIHTKRYFIGFYILSILLFGLSAWIGMGTQRWSGQFMTSLGLTHDLERFYFLLGRLALGILYVTVLILVPALIYKIASKEQPFKKVTLLTLFPLAILLLEQASYIGLMLWQGINWYSSPFSWGVIGQLFIEHRWTIYFLGCISLFKIWVMYWQFLSLRAISTLKWWAVILIILTLNLSFWAITATFATLNFYHLLFR
ncbi:hypothetical protein P6709_06280 [Jeotgalibacillus sp. ET6]|uniref:hypothetical protein n=1 Tax=Jeotgalibacillus sp. ET6 TaxID=3037260 RepID=UPI002418944B|nr:hypothetical protein [Jeotgalibacillus sp. ET6]MDG5471347.1 hypothetical protein [Jeotgalibacillus sp. ET6]